MVRSAMVVATVAVAAIVAGSAHATPRMPVGFYDDPSFRWSPEAGVNIASAAAAHTSIIHVLADWSAIAATKPAFPLNGNDPAYHLSDLDDIVQTAQKNGLQVMITIALTPKWANGGQTPNHPPTNLNNLTQFSRMLATRYNGTHPGFGAVNYFGIGNEPNLQLFLTPQFSGSDIVSAITYAKIFRAAYKGVKAGNRRALVAAGETSNRGRNKHVDGFSDSVAPATFAHLLSIADPKLPFDAWATHPYPSIYALGPSQRVAYPNVAFSTMTRFGADLKKWFNRRVPIWVTEYGEQTKPEYAGGVSYAQQAADARKALQMAAANPYVEMFIWFIFRDSSPQTWFSGVRTKSGAKKPAYNAFAAAAKTIDGQVMHILPHQSFSITVGAPYIGAHNAPGAKVGVNYYVYKRSKLVASGDPQSSLNTDATVTFKVAIDPQPKTAYTMKVTITDRGGQKQARTVALLPAG